MSEERWELATDQPVSLSLLAQMQGHYFWRQRTRSLRLTVASVVRQRTTGEMR